MTDEEKKAIEIIKYLQYKCIDENGTGMMTIYRLDDLGNALKILLNLIEKQQKEIKYLKLHDEKVCKVLNEEREKNESLIKERAKEIVYVDRNFIRKDRIKPIQIIDLDGKIHNVYKIEEE